jgi:integrase
MVGEIKQRGALRQAHNVYGHVRGFYNWALEQGIYGLTSSPCDRIRPTKLIGKKTDRDRVLADAEIGAFWRAAGIVGYPFGPLYRLLLLTGARKLEVGNARWSEFDLDQALWTIPAERYKSNVRHLVPLCDDVMALLEVLPRWKGGDYLFSMDGRRSVAGYSTSKERMDSLMRKELGVLPTFQVHDVRRTVRTKLAALRIPQDIAELVIGHSKRGLVRVYDRYTYLSEMREALTAWAAHLRSIVERTAENTASMRASA